MEREIRALHQRNEALDKEVRGLRRRFEGDDDAVSGAAVEKAVEPESPAGGKQEEGPLPASGLERDPYRGFHLTSEDGRYDLQLGGRVTGRFTALVADHPIDDEFSVKRARLFSDAHFLDHYSLRVQVEFSVKPTLKDGYVEVHYVPWARFRLGQFKVPFILEYQQSHKYIDFAERSIAVDPMRFLGRDIGAMLHGRSADGAFEYQLAVLNGAGENKGDDNSAKDLAGRLVVRPFRRAEDAALIGAHFGVSGTWGEQDAEFSSVEFLTVAGTKFVDFAPDTLLKGGRSRLATELVWLVGPASLKTEWMWMWLDDFRGSSVRANLHFYSWYVSASYLLTGERKTLDRIVPERPFRPSEGKWGAWELAARYSLFHSDDDLFRLGMASGTSRAEAFTMGLNWYLNEVLRLTLNYEHAKFDDDLVIDGKTLDDEHALLLQCQLEI